MTEVLELKKDIEQLKAGQSRQTVSAHINNPWIIAVALISLVIFVYTEQQENQDSGIKQNTILIQSLQKDQQEQTDNLTKLTAAVDQVTDKVTRNTDKLDSTVNDRFTDKDGASLRDLIRDNKIATLEEIRSNRTEMREWVRTIELRTDDLSEELSEIRGMMGGKK